jgi:hypothetical protein
MRRTGEVFEHTFTLITLNKWEGRRNIYNYMRFYAEIQTGYCRLGPHIPFVSGELKSVSGKMLRNLLMYVGMKMQTYEYIRFVLVPVGRLLQ